jgi:hypothetical protein
LAADRAWTVGRCAALSQSIGARLHEVVIPLTGMRVTRAAVAMVVLASVLGCDAIKSLYRRYTDPIVGTWREVADDATKGADNLQTTTTITFEGDGTYRVKVGYLDPSVFGEDNVKMARAFENVPARYSRGADTIVISYTVDALRKAFADLPKKGPDTMKGDTLDQVMNYKLSGDILETTTNGKTQRHVRVR